MTRTSTPAQHGERRCYLRGCRRPECAAAHARYCKQYRLATLAGPIKIDAAPVAAHIAHWTDRGYSLVQIAQATGRFTGELSRIRKGQQTAITPAVAHQILSVDLSHLAPHHAMVDATGTIRRGRALTAIGYPVYTIAERIPINHNSLGRILATSPKRVRLSTEEGMAAFYRTAARQPGGSAIAIAYARRRNWNGPLSWGDDIDDPAAEPEQDTDQSEITLRVDVEHLLRFGISTDEIQRRTGASHSYIRGLAAELAGRPRVRAAA
jgi:hypothetical protein